jgi:predicted RecA/RadA family phage recombinase
MAVAADQLKVMQDECRSAGPVAGSTILYANTLVFRNANAELDDDTGSGANTFAGIAVTRTDNSAGAAGDLSAEIFTEGVFQLTGSGFASTSPGKPVYASDNFTLTLTPNASTVLVGIIREYISSSVVTVRLITDRARAVSGVASQYRIARGTGTLDGANPTSIVTGLAVVLAFVATLKGTAAPGASTIVLTSAANATAGTQDVHAWKVTTGGAAGNPTLVASAGTEDFDWIAVGL